MSGRGGISKVIVVGGGLIGCAVARELAGCGCRVVLLERDRIGGESSSAAAGILCPQEEAEQPSPLLHLGMESYRHYGGFVESLREETGIDPQLDTAGTLRLDLTREDAAESERVCRWQRELDLPVETLSAREVEDLEPGLSGTILGGLRFPRSGRVDPAALTRAAAISARLRGADLRVGTPVESLKRFGDRVTGVVLPGGVVLEGEEVILASGAWVSVLAPEMRVGVVPIRGQMLVLETGRPSRRHVLCTSRAYLVPRRDGSVLVGSTGENVGFRKAVTPRAIIRLAATALAVDPGLEAAVLGEFWSGLRPGSADGLPLLGRVGPGLVAAAGHYRSGILLAPLTAVIVAELLMTGRTALDIAPFSPLRDPPRRGVLPEP
jgi:glycine oxidase